MTSPVSFNTPDRIIRFAMEEAGLLQDGDDPTGEQSAKYLGRLNDLVNAWQTDGIKLWTNKMLQIPLTAETAKYTLGPGDSIITTKPLRVLAGYYADANNVWRPLDPLSWDTYSKLSNPSDTGPITGYFVDKQQLNLVVTFWLIPDATAALGTAQLLLQQQITNLVSLTDSINFPQEWFMALGWGLADEICGRQAQDIVQRCQQRAMMYKQKLEDWDVEDASVYFQPDQQQGGWQRNF